MLVIVIWASFAPSLQTVQSITEDVVTMLFVIVNTCDPALAVVKPVNVAAPTLTFCVDDAVGLATEAVLFTTVTKPDELISTEPPPVDMSIPPAALEAFKTMAVAAASIAVTLIEPPVAKRSMSNDAPVVVKSIPPLVAVNVIAAASASVVDITNEPPVLVIVISWFASPTASISIPPADATIRIASAAS